MQDICDDAFVALDISQDPHDGGPNLREEALVTYERSIQSAFREVEDALISAQKLAEQLAAQEQTVAAERSRLDLSLLRYEGGVASYSDVLDAQRSLFSAELILAQLRGVRLAAISQLYRALGGGWNGAAEAGQRRDQEVRPQRDL